MHLRMFSSFKKVETAKRFILEKISNADSQLIVYVKFPARFTDGTAFDVLINPDGLFYQQVSETL